MFFLENVRVISVICACLLIGTCPGKLVPHEWTIVKTHTIEGQKMLDRVGGFMREVGSIVRSHRERWDGGGYPDRLSGAQIPVEARIISCCDTWNAMRTDRPYRKALDYATAEAELRSAAGTQLDPNLATAHLALGRAFVRFADRFRESVREDLAALRLNANDTHALNSLATYFVSVGDTQKAQCIGDRMVRIDPNSNEAKTRGYWYVNAVDPEGAMQNAQWALTSKDSELAGHDIRANADILLGNLPGATAEAGRVTALLPNHYLGKSLKAMIAAANGDKAGCEAALKTFEADANRNHWAAMRQALCYAKIGDQKEAVAWVERAAALSNHSWYAWVKHPWMQSVEAEPEFQKTIAKMKADLDDVRDDVIGVYQLICR